MRRIRILLGAALVATLIAGCAPTVAEPTASPSLSPTPTVTASPTPTPEPPAKPALADLVLTADGLGPLVLGQAPPVTDPSLDILIFDPEYCVGKSDLPGLWVANYPPMAEDIQPFGVTVIDGVLRRVDARDPAIATDTGIHVGSTLASVLAAYPGGFTTTITEGHLSDVYVIAGVHGLLLIEVAKDALPGYWEPSQLDTVVFLRSIVPESVPRPIAGTGNVTQVCYEF